MTKEAAKKILELLVTVDFKKECVVLENKGDKDLDIGGWVVQLEKQAVELILHEKAILRPGKNIRIWCGGKNKGRTFDAENYNWTRAKLSNKQEVANVLDNRGQIRSKSRPLTLLSPQK